MEHNLLIHRGEDHIGVAVTDIKTGDGIKGLVLADGSWVKLDASQDAPMPHKVAIKAASPGENIIICGQPAGVATQAIKPGEHVHIHNMKSLRWS